MSAKTGRKLFAAVMATALSLSGMTGVLPERADALKVRASEQAMERFLDVFYDAERNAFYADSDRADENEGMRGTEGGPYASFRGSAQIWQTMMDAYERTGDPAYETRIREAFDGFLEAHPDWGEVETDADITAWALGAIRAYELTGEARYAAVAKDMFDFAYAASWSDDFGGGLRSDRRDPLSPKEAAANATAASTAARLFRAFGDVPYWTKATGLYHWVRDTLYEEEGYLHDRIDDDGIFDRPRTHNFGLFADAALELYKITGDPQYLIDANAAVDWVVSHMTNEDETLLYEGDGDEAGYKLQFVRAVGRLAYEAKQKRYIDFLRANATQAWIHRRASDGIVGSDWTARPGAEPIGSLAAAAGVTILFLAEPDVSAGITR